MGGSIDNTALRAAARTAEHVLANAAQEAEQRYPGDPRAQRVAEIGMLTGALKGLLDAVRPFIREQEKAGGDHRGGNPQHSADHEHHHADDLQ